MAVVVEVALCVEVAVVVIPAAVLEDLATDVLFELAIDCDPLPAGSGELVPSGHIPPPKKE